MKHDAKKALKKFKAAAKAGRVVIGNAAAKSDKGSGSLLAWARGDKSEDYKEQYFGAVYSIPGLGFGSFTFQIVPCGASVEDGCIPHGKMKMVDSECMSREFVKNVLCRMVDEAEWDMDEKRAFKHDGKA